MVALAVGVFLGCWELLHFWFAVDHQLVDTPTYERYGLAMRNGLVPYRDIAIEYPPGALPLFVLPTYFSGYAAAFGWMIAACGAGCIVLASLAGAKIRALALIAVSPLLIGVLALTRFDFWPTLFVVGAVAALVHDRHRIGWALLGAAVVVKLFGVVLVPLAAAWTFFRRGRGELTRAVAYGVAVVAAVLVPFAGIAPSGLWHSFEGEASRPLQIESLGAAFLTTFGHPVMTSSHGSQNLAGHGALAAIATGLEIAVLVLLWLAFARGPIEQGRFVRYAAACVCAFVALGKVLSPQFLIWLIPLVALVRGARGAAASALLVAGLVLTQFMFPERYWEYVYGFHRAGVVLARDLVLVALLAVLVVPSVCSFVRALNGAGGRGH